MFPANFLPVNEKTFYGEPYCDVKNLTEKESANVLGDGWTVPVISHIFSFMNFLKKYLTFQVTSDILNNVRKINIIQLAKYHTI